MTATKEVLGIVRDLPAAAYHADPGINASILRLFSRSALHAREQMIHPAEPTEALEIGTALHLAVLEPVRFEAEYAAAPKCDRRTKEGKATWAAFQADHPHATVLDAEDFATIVGMRDSILSHETARQLVNGGLTEVSVFWEHRKRRCKARPDKVTTFLGQSWVVDVKTTTDASPWAFAASVAKLGYHIQAAWYLRGLTVVAEHERRFGWVAVEKSPPYAVGVYEPSLEMIDQGDKLALEYLARLVAAEESGSWPGYGGLRTIELPKWAVQEIG